MGQRGAGSRQRSQGSFPQHGKPCSFRQRRVLTSSFSSARTKLACSSMASWFSTALKEAQKRLANRFTFTLASLTSCGSSFGRRGRTFASSWVGFRHGCEKAKEDDEALLDAAKRADAVLFFGGLSHQYDLEGTDRKDMGLHEGQNELIARIAEVNPRTAVILVSGSPVEMPWVSQVPAILQMWYAGNGRWPRYR